MNIFYHIGKIIMRLFSYSEVLGKFFVFHISLIRKYFTRPFRIKQILIQIENIGFDSLGVIFLTAVFTGLVMTIQLYGAFRQFGVQDMLGYTIYLAIGKELGPVFTALMVISRAVSAMAAELGTMRVTEQIDAIDVLSVDSKKYLIIPRVIAMVIALPILTLFFDLVANLAAYVFSTQTLNINGIVYLNTIRQFAHINDFFQGIVKGVFFGFAISWIGTYIGYHTSGGARGVGRATTQAVVVASIALFLVNYFVSSAFLIYG